MLDKRKSHPSIYRQCSRADDNHAEKHSLFEVPISQASAGVDVTPEAAMSHIGVSGRIFDVNTGEAASHVSDDTKSTVFMRDAITTALKCPECGGLLHIQQSQ